MAVMRVRQAISTALADEMRADSSVMIFGEDVAAAVELFFQYTASPTEVSQTPPECRRLLFFEL